METPPRLLVVDDEPSIREPLAEYLTANGFAVDVAESAAAAREVLGAKSIDLVVLDVMMPGEDGFDFVRTLRSKVSLPVIFVTARTDDTDRIVGLELGADDYLVKPFNPRELLARIKAVLRRLEGGASDPSAGTAMEAYRFDGLTLVPEGRRLEGRDGEEISLTGGEYELLLAFVERPGRVLNRDQLLDITQGREAHLFDRAIDNQVSRLRKKIEEDVKSPSIIKTVRGGGYVFSARVVRS